MEAEDQMTQETSQSGGAIELPGIEHEVCNGCGTLVDCWPEDCSCDFTGRTTVKYVRVDLHRGAAAAERERIVKRLREMAGVLDGTEVARTANTLESAAAVIAAEGWR